MLEVGFSHTVPMRDGSGQCDELLNGQQSGSGLCKRYIQEIEISLSLFTLKERRTHYIIRKFRQSVGIPELTGRIL